MACPFIGLTDSSAPCLLPAGPFDINCGDTGYWVFTFLYIPFTVAVASYVACYLMKETVEKDEIGYPWIEGVPNPEPSL